MIERNEIGSERPALTGLIRQEIAEAARRDAVVAQVLFLMTKRMDLLDQGAHQREIPDGHIPIAEVREYIRLIRKGV